MTNSPIGPGISKAPPGPKQRQKLPQLSLKDTFSSARWRIVGWVMLTTAIAVGALIFSVRQVLLHEVTTQANAEIEQELGEFRTFAQDGKDPQTAQPFTSSSDMLQTYISRQFSGYSEQLIGVTQEQIIFLKKEHDHATQAGYQLHQDQELIETIKVSSSQSGVDQTPAGTIHWGVVNLHVSGERQEENQLIVVEYIQPAIDNVQHTMTIMLGIGAGALLLAFAISWLVAGQITKPVRALRKVANDITEKDITGRVPVRGSDDVAAMSSTFNQMLDRLEESSTVQRQFLDDVSHELRTPITIVRGHLELMERTTEDQEITLALVDDELDRMGRIVADLLLLAKSERPDFIKKSPTDIADLMISLDSKVQAFGSHRWVMSKIADGMVDLDQQRITQAMIQLCANAAQYSPPASKISIGTEYKVHNNSRYLDLWVRDRGPGVKPDDASALFERFRRNNIKNPAIAQKHSVGAGLGLAIVRTIAESHGGSVWIAQPAEGEGAIFGISIPVLQTATDVQEELKKEEP